MVSTGTKEHLDFLTHYNEQRSGHCEDITFDKIEESPQKGGGEIKVNLTTQINRKHNTPYKVTPSNTEFLLNFVKKLIIQRA